MTSAIQPKFSKGKANIMPVGQATPDDGVPPLVRAAKYVKFSRKENLRKLGNVEEEGKTTQKVHEDDPGKEYSDFIIVDATIHEDPMNGRNTAPYHEGDKVQKSNGHVLLLIEMMPGKRSKQDEASNSSQIKDAPGRGAPEGVVDAYK